MATGTSTPSKRRNAKPANGDGGTQAQSREKIRDLIDKIDENQVGEFNTLTPTRKFVVIDDQRHDLRLMQDFGLVEHQEWDTSLQEFEALYQRDQLNSKQRTRYEGLADWLLDHAFVDAKALRGQLSAVNPDTGEPRLTGALKRELILTFSQASAIKSLTQQLMDRFLEALNEIEAQGSSSQAS